MTPDRQAPAQSLRLPALRRSLEVELLAEAGGGFPSIVIADPMRGSYFRFDWPRSGMLLLWSKAETAEELQGLMLQTYGVRMGSSDIDDVAEFVVRSELAQAQTASDWQRLAAMATARRQGVLRLLLHNYLFFKVPLLHPDRMLRTLAPYAGFAFRRGFWIVVALGWALGIYLATRQWQDFADAVQRSITLQQLPIFGAALLFLKTIHELGHAVTTIRAGCRVPSMGVAFMLGAPMLYTDTSDSWRLSDSRARLTIVLAGVGTELIVGAVALLTWSVMADGTLRSVCFSLATASIAMSIAVNLNPFMRFDGYFALSDYLSFPNLQPRSFKLASWRLRELLFGLKAEPPEAVPARLQRFLVAYACSTWVYRLFLFLGIAAIVYVMFGKAIGIVLGLIEIGVFILLPIWRELKEWWKLRGKIVVSRRSILTGAAASLLVATMCVPWVRTVESPAVLIAAGEQEIHLPVPALIKSVAVRGGELVRAGELLLEAQSRELDRDLAAASLKLRLLRVQLSRLMSSETEREQAIVLQNAYRMAKQRLTGLRRLRAQLRVVAPFDGRVVDVDPILAAGAWAAPEELLARVVDTGGARVKALIADADLPKVAQGARGVFVADEADLAAHPVVLTMIAPASNGKLSEAIWSERFGGPVASNETSQAEPTQSGWVEVSYRADGPAPDRLVRGVIQVEADARSPLDIAWQRIGRILVREQSF